MIQDIILTYSSKGCFEAAYGRIEESDGRERKYADWKWHHDYPCQEGS